MKTTILTSMLVCAVVFIPMVSGSDTWVKRSSSAEIYGKAEHSPEILLKSGGDTNNINEYYKNAKLHLQMMYSNLASELDENVVSLRYEIELEDCAIFVNFVTKFPESSRSRSWTVQFDCNRAILDAKVLWLAY